MGGGARRGRRAWHGGTAVNAEITIPPAPSAGGFVPGRYSFSMGA